MKKLELSIKTTSLCNRMCKHCTVRPWMKANPNFHTSIEQIDNLIKYSKESNYHWEYILLSGGEPLLWHNVLTGTKLLYESGICSRLILLTNGLAITTNTLSKIQKIMENVHEFRISRYKDNSENIKLAEEYFGKLRNKYDMPVLNVVDRGEHLIPPEEPVADSLPTECTCKAYAMVGDYMDYCGP
ncbi:MAG TPA: radical SAM protein, partial [Anaerolineae bacterium]|nr:radical SAM protein [Anaerolineae bacterium]